MKKQNICIFALFAHLCSCSTPEPIVQQPANLGRVGLICAPGASKLKVERPGSPGELFSQGTIRHAKCSVRAGVEVLSDMGHAGPFIGFALMATAAAAPLTGIVNATRGVPMETGMKRQNAQRSTLDSDRWNAVLSRKVKAAAVSRGHAIVFARGLDSCLGSEGLADRCTAVRTAGGNTLAEVEIMGPSMVVASGWSQPLQVRVALRVRFYNVVTCKLRRTVWIQVQDGPKRTQKDWGDDSAGLATEVCRLLEKAAAELAVKLSTTGGTGEVIASYL